MVNNVYRSTSIVDNPVQLQHPSTFTEIQNGPPSDIQVVVQNSGFHPTEGGNALLFSQRVRRLRGYVRGVVLQGLVEMVVLKGHYPI